jgi:hypothetical protein
VTIFTTPIQHNSQSLSQSKKSIQTGKRKVKLSLFPYDMFLYVGNPKDATKELIEQMKKFSKAVGYKTKYTK